MSIILVALKTLLLIALSLTAFWALAVGLDAGPQAAPQAASECEIVEIKTCVFLIF